MTPLVISVIVPAFNEQATIESLGRQLLSQVGRSGEVLFIDDGSTDQTWSAMSALAASHDQIRAFRLRRNGGKASALAVGIAHARGDIVVTIDADLQDDPAEIPRLIGPLDEGYDLVSGWKQDRQDPASKTVASRLFNAVTRTITGVPIHDFNCGLKAGRRELYARIPLYGELHRYIPVLADHLGYRVTEVPVRHHARAFGQSKYGVRRLWSGLLDLLTVLTLTRYGQRPGHLFGGFGLLLGASGFLVLTYLSARWALGDAIGHRPLLLLGMLLSILGVQFVSFGMLAELVLHRTQANDPTTLVCDVVEHERRRERAVGVG